MPVACPPEETACWPKRVTTAPVAVPPADTTCSPPESMALVERPLARMNSAAVDLTMSPVAVPPLSTVSSPPPEIVSNAAWPPVRISASSPEVTLPPVNAGPLERTAAALISTSPAV